MRFTIFADIVVFIHFLWILFLITGAYWAARHRTVMAFHAGGLLFAVIMQIFGWYCPLTHIEVWLRQKHDSALSYPGSFIAHYTEKLVYFQVTGRMIFVLTVLLISANAWIYWRLFKSRHVH